jgi:UrcA family protein
MTNYTARFAGVATLALALLPAAALTTTAHASTYPAAAVRVADLNLASPAGQNTFAQRIDSVARKVCASQAALDLKAACMAGVRTEVNEKARQEIRLAARN